MKTSITPFILLIVFILSSCSSIHKVVKTENLIEQDSGSDEVNFIRTPSSDCHNTVLGLLKNKKPQNSTVQAEIYAKNLLTLKEKYWTMPIPKLDKWNELKRRVMISFKNWHGNKYPTFYLINEPDLKLVTEKYSKAYLKSLQSPETLAEDEKQVLSIVDGWKKSYESFDREIDAMLDERISLQYNLYVLKNFKVQNEREELRLTFIQNGNPVEKVYVFYKKDQNQILEIKNLKKQLKKFDESLQKEGLLKNRVIRQAMLKDLLTYAQRDIELVGLNEATGQNQIDILAFSKSLSSLVNNKELNPTSFGVHKVTSKLLWDEILPAKTTMSLVEHYRKTGEFFRHNYDLGKQKTRRAIEITKDSPRRVKEKIEFTFRVDKDENGNKIDFFDRMFARIAAADPRKIALATGAVALGWIGIDQYFNFEPKADTQCLDPKTQQSIKCEEPAKRLENTKQALEDQNKDLTDKIEETIVNLF